jgi:hypothetical protein
MERIKLITFFVVNRMTRHPLYWNTVNPLLRNVLDALMTAPEFDSFRLVGGTSLSLQYGHRVSVDIDLFTDSSYGSINFTELESFLLAHFPYTSGNEGLLHAMGSSWFVGNSEQDAVKIDVYYTDSFIRPPIIEGNLRLATTEDIIAMKLDIVARGGRKKDFWDLHELADHYDIPSMIAFHRERYPFGHDEKLIRLQLVDFELAEDDFDPECLRGKYWELIKLDFIEWMKSIE